MDPRILRTRDKVQRAALAELADKGYAALTIDGVARRCGVARTTIYRHWDTPAALALDALATLNTQPDVAAAQGTARDQVLQLLTHLTQALSDPLIGGCLVALVDGARRDPAVRTLLTDYSSRRGAALVAVVERGIEEGAFARGDARSAADALAGAVFYRTLVAPGADPGALEVLVDTVLGRLTR